MQLISYPIDYLGHVSQDTVREFENAILKDENVDQVFIDKTSYVVGKVLAKTDYGILSLAPLKSSRLLERASKNICIFMGHEFKKALVPFLMQKNNNAYFFDAWPDRHDRIERFIRFTNLTNVFFSSKQVTEIFRQKGLNTSFHWIPEAINLTDYEFEPYENKTVDVLSFGRKYGLFHDKVVEGLAVDRINYLYESRPGQIIFPDRPSFIKGLSKSKISICIPSNITNVKLTKGISTMTVRYLQSMAAKNLIVGRIPDEMKELFNYDPIVQLNMENPLQQLKDILQNFSAYIPLIERNYDFIARHHTWEHRWGIMKKIING